jgi:phage-related protein
VGSGGPVIDGTLRTAKGIIEVITGLISGDWGQFWQGIKDITFGQLELIRSKITAVLQLAALAFETALGIIWDLVSGAWDEVYGYTTDKLGQAYDYVTALPGRMTAAFLDWSIVRTITGFWSDAHDVTVYYGGAMVSYVAGLPGRIGRAVGDLSSLLYNTGLDVVYGLWDGIKDGGSWLKDKLTGWADDYVLNPVQWALSIGSPSKVMRDEVGVWIPAGIAEGIDAGAGQVEDAMTSLVSVPRVPGATGSGYGATTSYGPGGTPAGGTTRVVLDVTGGEDAFARWVRGWVRAEGGTGDDSAQRAFAGV